MGSVESHTKDSCAGNDLPGRVSSETADGFEAGAVAGQFTVTISAPSSTDTVIDYTLTGTATSGTDYTPLTGQVTILAGDTFATIDIPTIDDAMAEPTETVIATLTGIASGDADISIGGTSSGTINLIDNDSVTWSITGDASVTEGGTASYVLHMTGVVPNGEAITLRTPTRRVIGPIFKAADVALPKNIHPAQS